MSSQKNPVGFGSIDSKIKIYIANTPPIDEYPDLQLIRGLSAGEILHIIQNTSNHWRKVFNVCAKMLFEWNVHQQTKNLPPTWQDYRDVHLFQSHSNEALMFTPPEFSRKDKSIHIVAGKIYGLALDLPPLMWLDKYFAVNEHFRLVVCPYPDYRQLSDARIAQLITLMKNLQ